MKINHEKMNPIDLQKVNRVHFIGIGGIGLSAIARLMLSQGKIVSGSDANRSEITDELEKMGAKIFIGQKEENLADDTKLVIYTLAIPKTNPELAKALKMKIGLLAYPEALGLLFNNSASGRIGIAICGTHGKSSTTSMASLVLAEGGLDPSVVVGSKVPAFGGNLRIGKGKYFVIEACEYERAFLSYYPRIIVMNNIELDHTDYYKNIDDFRSAFEEFAGHLPENGVLICNGDDENISKIQIKNEQIKIINFGLGENNDVHGYDIKAEAGKTKFKVRYNGKEIGEFELKVPGKFNVYNALAAIALGMYLGIDKGKIKKALAEYAGIWRRFEIKGEYKASTVISDYAHHPTAVKMTIEAAREFYPGRRILAVFQPHQHNRTKNLYRDFLRSFDSADVLILVEIFDVAGREEKKDQDVSSRKMTEDIKSVIARSSVERRGNPADSGKSKSIFLQPNSIFYAANLVETRKLIDEKIQAGDVLLIMGAGDIYKVADELVKE